MTQTRKPARWYGEPTVLAALVGGAFALISVIYNDWRPLSGHDQPTKLALEIPPETLRLLLDKNVGEASPLSTTSSPVAPSSVVLGRGRANALVMPFDATRGATTRFMVSNLGGLSPTSRDGFLAGITTHWAFWAEGGLMVAETSVCLPLSSTVLLDSENLATSMAVGDSPAEQISIVGHRGFVVVTAYATNDACAPVDVKNQFDLVDDAIVGSFSINGPKGRTSCSGDAMGFGLDFLGERTELVFRMPDPDETGGSPVISVQTLPPQTLTSSQLLLFALEEGVGRNGKEIGPIRRPLLANAQYCAFDGQCTDLSPLEIAGAAFRRTSDILARANARTSGVVRLRPDTPREGAVLQILHAAEFGASTFCSTAIGSLG